MYHSILIEDLAIVLCLAAFVAVLFQKIKQPIVLGYLIAGIIIGPYTPPFSFLDDEAEIRLLAELGIIFLMFSIGLEFTLSKLTRLGLPALIIGVFEVIFMLLIGFLVGEYLGWSNYESLLLGAALSISSTTIIIKALEEFNLKRYSFAELMVGVLLIEDLMAILLLVYISTTGAADQAIFSWEVLYASLELLLVISSWFLIGYFTLPFMMRRIQNYINHETLIIISVGLCLFLSTVAVHFNYSAALGAFIMGAILAETPLAQKIATLTLPVRDIFAAVFFVSVGMLIDPNVIFQYWDTIILLSLITVIGKILASGGGALLAGQSMADSIRIGFSMAQIGEFSFIIIGIGGTIQLTDKALYPIIVAIAAITTFVTPYLIKLGIKISPKAEEKIPLTWKKGLRKYHEMIEQFSPKDKEKKLGRQGQNFIRFVINAVIVAMIAILCAHVIIPRLLPIVNKEWPIQLLFWFIACVIASPFIWGLLFATSRKKTGRIKRIIIWFITLTGLCLIAVMYFTFPLLMIPLSILLYGYFNLCNRLIKKTYAWLEHNLIYNLTRNYEIDPRILQKLAPWDNELVRVKVSNQFPFIGRTLQESRLRPFFGINIIAIKRAFKTLWLPGAKERILPDDELVILGEKEEIDDFREFAQRVEGDSISSEQQPELQIQTLHIGAEHHLKNHAISDDIVKEEIQGLIVGLDRQGEHILNPTPSTVLHPGDILLYIIKKPKF